MFTYNLLCVPSFSIYSHTFLFLVFTYFSHPISLCFYQCLYLSSLCLSSLFQSCSFSTVLFLSVCLSLSLPVSLCLTGQATQDVQSIPSVLSCSLFVGVSVYLFVCMSVSLSVCIYVCLFVYLSHSSSATRHTVVSSSTGCQRSQSWNLLSLRWR